MGKQAKMERADSNSRIRRPMQLSLELASLLGRQGPQPWAFEDEVLALLTEAGHVFPPQRDLTPAANPKQKWQLAFGKAVSFFEDTENDPWAAHDLPALHTELAVRHDYNATTRCWTNSETLVKIQGTPFAEGAMRECFRMKKMSQQPGSKLFYKQDWVHASNYVAKRYKDKAISNDVYFHDVKMQMEAKMWALNYNGRGPTRKVDMIQCFLLEFPNRAGAPIYCVEAFQTGEYIKYNNNSGFFETLKEGEGGEEKAEQVRQSIEAAQTFSHYTYEASDGKIMCVDVQGVGDLYTDPQFHSAEGTGYGEGDLGRRGMALFLATHVCGPQCHRIGLPVFPKSPKEKVRLAGSCTQATVKALAGTSRRQNLLSTVARSVLRNKHGHRRFRGKMVVKRSSVPASLLDKNRHVPHIATQGGPIHWEMARVNFLGGRPGLLEEPDAESAFFHLVMAGMQCGWLPALKALQKLFSGMQADDFEGMVLDEEDAALAGWCLELVAARGGRKEMSRLARKLEGEGAMAAAADWYERALRASWTDADDAEAEFEQLATYQLLQRLGGLYLSGADGLPKDGAKAAENLRAAAEIAMEKGKFKLSMKLSAQADAVDV